MDILEQTKKPCPMRHENGNCLPTGGFCTANSKELCEALHRAYDCGKESVSQHTLVRIVTPQKVMRTTTHEDVKVGRVVFCAGTDIYQCPSCGSHLTAINSHCHGCGQLLDWGDECDKFRV